MYIGPPINPNTREDMKRTRRIVVLLCLSMMISLIGCGKSNSGKTTGEGTLETGTDSQSQVTGGESGNYKKEIVIGLSNVFTTTDMQSTASITNQIFYTVSHSTLLKWNYDTSEYVSDLAKSYTVSDDGTVYTFYLQDNAYFHNGEKVKASDVIYSFERGKTSSATASKVQIIKEIKALDDLTLEITLSGPSTGFLFDVTNSNMSILSEKAMTELGEEGTKIGSGAFYYDNIDFGNEVRMARFDQYFGEMPKTETLIFRQYSEDATRVIALQAGDIDYCQTPSTVDLDYIQEDPNLDLIQMKGTRLNYMVMNVSEERGTPFTDIRVRQAVNMVINKEDVVVGAANGIGEAQNFYFTDICYGFYGGMEGYSYNIEKAKELLTEAGYPNGFSFSLLCHDSTAKAIAPILQDQLGKIGITLNIEEVETAVRNTLIEDNDFDACMAAHVSLVSCDNNLRLLFYTGAQNNRMKYSNEKFDTMLDAALVEQNETKRMEMYKELQTMVVDEALCVPLYVETLNIAKKSSLQGVKLNATGCHDFSYAYIEE